MEDCARLRCPPLHVVPMAKCFSQYKPLYFIYVAPTLERSPGNFSARQNHSTEACILLMEVTLFHFSLFSLSLLSPSFPSSLPPFPLCSPFYSPSAPLLFPFYSPSDPPLIPLYSPSSLPPAPSSHPLSPQSPSLFVLSPPLPSHRRGVLQSR